MEVRLEISIDKKNLRIFTGTFFRPQETTMTAHFALYYVKTDRHILYPLNVVWSDSLNV